VGGAEKWERRTIRLGNCIGACFFRVVVADGGMRQAGDVGCVSPVVLEVDDDGGS
jgi:hypothetical protein